MSATRFAEPWPAGAAEGAGPEIVYLGRSHFRRSRANLIQTLHMVQAFERIGCRTRLYLPARRGCADDLRQRLEEFGVSGDLDVRFTALLKSRWQFGLFTWLHRTELTSGALVYTRSPEISIRLGRAGIRHSLEVHDIAEVRKKTHLRPLVEHHQQKILEWMFPISTALRGELIKEGVDRERMQVAPSGTDIDAYADVAPLDASRLERPRVLYLGRVSRDRGLDILAALARTGEVDVTLVGDQDDHVDGPMRFVPFVPPREVPQWYAQCDLVLLPYQPDLPHAGSISPIKLFEAMAAGRPIIASDLPTMREIITHGENGLLVDPLDVDEWRSAVRSLKEDRAIATRIAAQARNDAAQYSWRSRARNILNCIRTAQQPAAPIHQ